MAALLGDRAASACSGSLRIFGEIRYEQSGVEVFEMLYTLLAKNNYLYPSLELVRICLFKGGGFVAFSICYKQPEGEVSVE